MLPRISKLSRARGIWGLLLVLPRNAWRARGDVRLRASRLGRPPPTPARAGVPAGRSRQATSHGPVWCSASPVRGGAVRPAPGRTGFVIASPPFPPRASPTSAGPPSALPPRRGASPGSPHRRARRGSPHPRQPHASTPKRGR